MTNTPTSTAESGVWFYDYQPDAEDFQATVLEGLARSPRGIPPKFFYDEQGSHLFEVITGLPEYYPTRTEIAILRQHGPEIAACLGRGGVLVELGSGSSRKIRLLLGAFQPEAYVAIDISRRHLLASARSLAAEHPGLAVYAVCADFTAMLHLPEEASAHRPRTVFFPGSSIGNFEPGDAAALLQRMGRLVGHDGKLLIGVDLKKDPAQLHAAYNDSRGVTAAFNRNLLARINRELDADFDVDGFRHHAFYNETQGRVEMHLVSAKAQTVRINGHAVRFETGDGIHTENSYKYSLTEFAQLARTAGLESEAVWTDPRDLFSLHCLRAAGSARGAR